MHALLIMSLLVPQPDYSTLRTRHSKAHYVVFAGAARFGEDRYRNKTVALRILSTGRTLTPTKAKRGEMVPLGRATSRNYDTTYLLIGQRNVDKISWRLGPACDRETWQYMKAAPLKQPFDLASFIPFLEHKHGAIARDAELEFRTAPFAELKKIRTQFPAKKLREWIHAGEQSRTARISTYGVMLGLQRDSSDRELFERYLFQAGEEVDRGLPGMMKGYLLVTGPDGLKRIVEKFVVAEKDRKILFYQRYAAVGAIEFIYDKVPLRISPDDLLSAMHLMVEDPEMVDLILARLARWKDWSQLGQAMKLLPKATMPRQKTGIIRYVIQCSQPGAKNELPSVVKARKYLEELERDYPAETKTCWEMLRLPTSTR